VQGVWIAAAITTATALAVVGGVLRKNTPLDERRLLLALVALELPACALAYYAFRVHLDHHVVRPLIDPHGPWYAWVVLLYAPLTEEPAKLWPLLIPSLRRRVTAANAARVGFALGLGFGVGELWFIADRIAASGKSVELAWYGFGGFFGERLTVCVLHGAITSVALHFLPRSRAAFAGGVLAGMALHTGANAPIVVAALGLLFSKDVWFAILAFWVPAYTMAVGALAGWLASGNLKLGATLLGKARCSLCHAVYERSLLAVNVFHKRYERCSACGRWQWVDLRRDLVE
jgi:hypothetical protein